MTFLREFSSLELIFRERHWHVKGTFWSELAVFFIIDINLYRHIMV